MKFATNGIVLTIRTEDADDYIRNGDGCIDVMLEESKVRELVAHLWENHPGLLREIICDNCPEVY